MVARNDITGDNIQTKGTSEAYRNNYDAIFGRKKPVDQCEPQPQSDSKQDDVKRE